MIRQVVKTRTATIDEQTSHHMSVMCAMIWRSKANVKNLNVFSCVRSDSPDWRTLCRTSRTWMASLRCGHSCVAWLSTSARVCQMMVSVGITSDDIPERIVCHRYHTRTAFPRYVSSYGFWCVPYRRTVCHKPTDRGHTSEDIHLG